VVYGGQEKIMFQFRCKAKTPIEGKKTFLEKVRDSFFRIQNIFVEQFKKSNALIFIMAASICGGIFAAFNRPEFANTVEKGVDQELTSLEPSILGVFDQVREVESVFNQIYTKSVSSDAAYRLHSKASHLISVLEGERDSLSGFFEEKSRDRFAVVRKKRMYRSRLSGIVKPVCRERKHALHLRKSIENSLTKMRNVSCKLDDLITV
jgi:hypothetical protein